MSFEQDKLNVVTLQSVGSINIYTYEPSNGDASTDVMVTGYFEQSRFIDTDGWVSGFIFCNLDDGAFIMQVASTGITVTQVGAGGGDIPAIESDIAILDANSRGISLINMGGDDVILSDAQSENAIKAILNTGDGTKSITVPTSADDTSPSISAYVMTIGTNSAEVISETGGDTAQIYSNDGATALDIIVIAPLVGAFSFVAQAVKSANKMMPYDSATVTDDTDVTGLHSGVLLQMNNAAPKAFNFSDANVSAMTPNAKGQLRMKGAGVVTITASGTATVDGKTTLAINDIVTWYRDGSTTNIIVG